MLSLQGNSGQIDKTCPNQGVLNYIKLTKIWHIFVTVDKLLSIRTLFCQLFVILDNFLSTFCSLGTLIRTCFCQFDHCFLVVCGLGWPKHLGEVFAGSSSILLEGHPYDHGEFAHCLALWHITLCTHSQWCLPTSFAEIPTGGLCLSSTWGVYNSGYQGRVHNLWENEMLSSGLLLLIGKDGKEYCKHSKNLSTCHLPIEGTVHPEPAVVLKDLPCFVCREKKWAAMMLLCDKCQRSWHMTCLRPPLTSLPSG